MAQHPAVELTAQLIGISSENPDRLEGEVIRFIADWLTGSGVDFQLQDVAPGRQNIIARVRGRGKRGPLALISHCDTVPAGQGWTHDPFAARIEDGKMYGRGASDMKGGLAASLYAIKEVRKIGSPPGDLILAVTVDEEGPGMLGVMALIEAGLVDANTMVISPEPTSLDIIRTHKGVMWYEVITHGVMSHAGNADKGVDANHALAEVICELKSAANAVPFVDPLVGRTLLSVGKMGGGTKTNVVPNYARAEIDLRVPPPFQAEHATVFMRRAAERAILKVQGASVDVNPLGMLRPPVETPEESPVVRMLKVSSQRVTGKAPPVDGYPAYTDAAVVSWKLRNRNSVLFGPASLKQAHTVDEWAYIEEIAACAEVFKDVAMSE